jgi:trimeric autotransporter adhesin
MTSNNQVSPVIRISRGERDASARATHLKAASKKYLETTIERKQMSTTTNFKRIALVAVAALGLGVLNSVPSNAALSGDTMTLSSTSVAQTTAETYTATSAVVTVSFYGSVARDSMSITASITAPSPALNTALPTLRLIETTSAWVDSASASGLKIGETVSANTATKIEARSTSAVNTAKFAVYLTDGNGLTGPTLAGTYTVLLTPASVGGSGALVNGTTSQKLTITVTKAASQDVVASAATTKTYIQPAASTNNAVAGDSVVSVANSNTSATRVAWIVVNQLNAAGAASSDSLVAEVSGPGQLGSGDRSATSRGRNLTVKAGDSITVWADGTSGESKVTIKSATSGATLATKSLTFYGAATALTGTAKTSILAIGSGNTRAVYVSANSGAVKMGSLIDETIYAFSSDTTIATVPATAVADYAGDSGTVTVTGVKAGTATITFGNASTLAASTIKSTPVTVRVGSTAIASVKVAFDKSSYAPGEKAVITVTNLDSTDLPTTPGEFSLYFASTKALKEDKTFSQGSLLADSTTVMFASATDATVPSTAGSATYVVYMPTTAGTVKVSGTLGTDAKLATALQGTVVSATANVTDSGSAALAAVTALATTVASLRTLIVTLTNLVLKIQKKVKA